MKKQTLNLKRWARAMRRNNGVLPKSTQRMFRKQSKHRHPQSKVYGDWVRLPPIDYTALAAPVTARILSNGGTSDER